MGLHDRDYYRESEYTGFSGFRVRSLVFVLICTNVAIWIVQWFVFGLDQPGPGESSFLEAYFACSRADVFEKGYVWQLVTANFLHDPVRPIHIFGNMLFLFFFGRELEEIYGKRDFLIFYLTAGVLAMFAQIAIVGGSVLGASGSVAAVVMLYTLLFPKRTVYLFLAIPVPIWAICAIFVFLNFFGALGASVEPAVGADSPPIAFIAHLGGLAFGAIYRFVDLRWDTLRYRFLRAFKRSRPRPRKRQPAPIIEFAKHAGSAGSDSVSEPDPEIVAISERIDKLLDKISESGQESLTAEELEFLKQNSQKYRSRR